VPSANAGKAEKEKGKWREVNDDFSGTSHFNQPITKQGEDQRTTVKRNYDII
jgi:hypothetical protein